LAADADVINEPVTTPTSTNLVFTELLNVSKLDVSTSKLVNLVNADELKVFKFVIETPCASFVVLAADADDINEPLTTPISVNLLLIEKN
jgi:hypothetical protein